MLQNVQFFHFQEIQIKNIHIFFNFMPYGCKSIFINFYFIWRSQIWNIEFQIVFFFSYIYWLLVLRWLFCLRKYLFSWNIIRKYFITLNWRKWGATWVAYWEKIIRPWWISVCLEFWNIIFGFIFFPPLSTFFSYYYDVNIYLACLIFTEMKDFYMFCDLLSMPIHNDFILNHNLYCVLRYYHVYTWSFQASLNFKI